MMIVELDQAFELKNQKRIKSACKNFQKCMKTLSTGCCSNLLQVS
jgi:hypothetical protein